MDTVFADERPGSLGAVLRGPVGRLLAVSLSMIALLYVPGVVRNLIDTRLDRVAGLQPVDGYEFVEGCHQAGCRFETIRPTPASPVSVPARWLAPEPLALAWPEQIPFGTSSQADDVQSWLAMDEDRTDGRTGDPGWHLRVDSNDGGYHAMVVPTPDHGYMAALEFEQPGRAPLTLEARRADAGKGARARLAGASQNGPNRYGKPVKRGPDLAAGLPSSQSDPPTGPARTIHFQPVPNRLSFAIDGLVGAEPAASPRAMVGDPTIIRFESAAATPDPFDVEGRVAAVSSGVVTIDVDPANRFWLRGYFASTVGRAPASDRISLRITESLGGAAGTSVGVPASALVRETPRGRLPAGEAIVWAVHKGELLPIHVRVGREDSDSVMVNEVRQPLNGAIPRQEWASLNHDQRARIRRQTEFRGAAGNQLLFTDTPLLVQPTSRLHAGDPGGSS